MQLHDLFFGSGTAHTLVVISLIAFLGILIGKINFFGIQIGIAGVLFSGLAVGAMGMEADHNVLHFIKEFGLILFVFTIGLQVGPRFISSLKADGVRLNILAAMLVLSGVLIAFIEYKVFGISLPAMVGILSGAVTNTPGLGAAQQALTEGVSSEVNPSALAGMAYAVAYPFGIVGIITSMILIRKIFKIDVDVELKKLEDEMGKNEKAPEVVNLKIRNLALVGKPFGDIAKMVQGPVVISRLLREEKVLIPSLMDVAQGEDTILAVGSKEHVETLADIVGGKSEQDIRSIVSRLGLRNILVTDTKVTRKNLRELNLFGRYQANITRINRGGIQFTPSPSTYLHIGDSITIVGQEDLLDTIGKELGNSKARLDHPNILPIFIGIFLGVVLGLQGIPLPGIPSPLKLGLAGGPLLIALFMGWKGKLGPLNFYLPPASNNVLKEVGIVLFLACVGLSSGKGFIPSLLEGDGVKWMLAGTAITFIPVFLTGVVARLKGMNYLHLAGLLAGGMTDPPALGYANSLGNSSAQSIAYAAVYPLVMILRILTAQLFVLLLL